MMVLVILGYILVGTVEISQWDKRPWKKILVYLILLVFAAGFSLLMMNVKELAVPSPVNILGEWLKKLWP